MLDGHLLCGLVAQLEKKYVKCIGICAGKVMVRNTIE